MSLLLAVYGAAGIGGVTLSPPILSNTNSLYPPTIILGSISLSPSIYSNSTLFFTPSVNLGPIILGPTILSNSNQIYSSNISTIVSILPTTSILSTNVIYASTISILYSMLYSIIPVEYTISSINTDNYVLDNSYYLYVYDTSIHINYIQDTNTNSFIST